MSHDAERLQTIQDELNAILEERVTELLGQMKAIRDVASQIAAAETEIRRHEAWRSELDQSGANDAESRSTAANLSDTIERLRRAREELMNSLGGLSAEIKGQASGS